jgi:hypothetical protein
MPKVLNKRNVEVGDTDNKVYVGRPTRWGNPFVVGRDGKQGECVTLHRDWLLAPERASLRQAVRAELRGKDLVCWCAPRRCHADVLLEIANSDEEAAPAASEFCTECGAPTLPAQKYLCDACRPAVESHYAQMRLAYQQPASGRDTRHRWVLDYRYFERKGAGPVFLAAFAAQARDGIAKGYVPSQLWSQLAKPNRDAVIDETLDVMDCIRENHLLGIADDDEGETLQNRLHALGQAPDPRLYPEAFTAWQMARWERLAEALGYGRHHQPKEGLWYHGTAMMSYSERLDAIRLTYGKSGLPSIEMRRHDTRSEVTVSSEEELDPLDAQWIDGQGERSSFQIYATPRLRTHKPLHVDWAAMRAQQVQASLDREPLHWAVRREHSAEQVMQLLEDAARWEALQLGVERAIV